MKIEILKNETYSDISKLPVRGTPRSTGYDIVTTSDPEIVGEKNENGYNRIDYIQYKTNLKLAVKVDTHFGAGIIGLDYDILAMPRSSVSKYNLILANCVGLIDADYRGEVLLRFKYIWQPEDYSIHVSGNTGIAKCFGNPNIERLYKNGDKVCQLKVTRVENVEFILVDALDSTQRGTGGFGSTTTVPTTADISKENDSFKERMRKFAASSVMQAYEISEKNLNIPEKKYSELMKENSK
jgi:hypothetical protein